MLSAQDAIKIATRAYVAACRVGDTATARQWRHIIDLARFPFRTV